MDRIRLVAIDMDATLLDDNKRVPGDFIPWVKSHPSIKTVIASGDQYGALKRYLGEIEDDLIFLPENGGLVFEKGELIYSDKMSYEDIKLYLSIADKVSDAFAGICGEKSAYFPPTKDEDILRQTAIYYEQRKFVEDLLSAAEDDIIVKMTLYFKKHNAEQYYPLFKDKSSTAIALLSGTDWIDVENSTSSKGASVRMLQKRYGIPPENCMAFGDYLNDISMLQACEQSYAMANAYPEVFAYAKYRTASNNDDGVMKILRTIPEG